MVKTEFIFPYIKKVSSESEGIKIQSVQTVKESDFYRELQYSKSQYFILLIALSFLRVLRIAFLNVSF